MTYPQFIAEKIIQFYNITIVKLREKNYKIIENQPDRENEIKKRMILSNVYSMRMNVDLAFKRIMLKRLHQALETKITIDSVKKLLSIVIDELEQPSEQLFEIFETSNQTKIQMNWEPFFKYVDYMIKLPNQRMNPNFSEEARKDVDFFKNVLEKIEKNTTFYRALEDIILEFESGIFFPRYFKKGEVKNYITYHFNPYLILLMEQRIQNMLPIVNFNVPLLLLLPEYLISLNKVSKLIYDTLNDLFELPANLSKIFFSYLSSHFMSVLMLILFEELNDDEKLDILNTNYSLDISEEDIKIIGDNIEEFQKIALLDDVISPPIKEVKEIKSKFNYLWVMGHKMFELGLFQYSQKIDDYLNRNETNELLQIIALDNFATAKRDLGEFSQSIDLYEQIIEFYEKNHLHYRKFLVQKNIAYCYYHLGQTDKATKYFAELEIDFSVYTEDELISVYYNLAYRYRLIYDFEKEEEYLNIILERIKPNHPLNQEILARASEIEMCFNPMNGKLNKEKLKQRDVNATYEKYKKYAYTHLNNNNLDLCQYYLKLVYKDKPLDQDYWKMLSVIYILREDWKKLLDSGEKILNLNSFDYIGHFYQCVAHIAEKNFSKILYHLLQIESEIVEVNSLDVFAFANLSRALSFLCFYFSSSEIKEFLNFVFENHPKVDYKVHKLLSIFASIFVNVGEKELSGYIYKKCLDLDESIENLTVYGDWCYHFNDYKNSKHFYLKALKISPNNIILLEKTSRICLELDEFSASIECLDKILEIVNPRSKKIFEDYRNYILVLRDAKIRYEKIPFKDVRIIFNTMEHQLKSLNPSQEIEFGNVLTEFSKGLENLLAKTIGVKIHKYIEKTHFPIPNLYRFGNNKDIKPINRIFLNYLDNPLKNNPTMGNWRYITNGILKNQNPENPILQEIYDFVKKSSFYKRDKLDLIIKLADVYLSDRNDATHKKIYRKEEVETLLKKMIPQVNDLIEYLLSI